MNALRLAIFVLLAGAMTAAAEPTRVVATNSWTAAFAAAAGATDIVTLAPPGLRHPAEYELKPSDVAALRGAGLIVYTGFEVMARKLADAAGTQSIRLLKVDADYTVPVLRASINAIADALGTQAVARRNLAELEAFLASWKSELSDAGLGGTPIVVHVFQKPLMEQLGFSVSGVFGPGPLEAAQIARLSPTGARLIVDNWHNEAGGPLRETMKSAGYASLINFPGEDATKTLLDVLKDDRDRLKAAAGY
ncbi:MAG TPA: zinc ABC transporter substrate-binding protein [Spirochaetia bacterium]|nr:zinc ABC transporter substrate-binding protein [Spirochaetia bacterium]